VNRPWIDGAIEQIRGTARVFVPDGPCYECTMSQADWKALQQRRSCNLLTRAQMQQERTPTTPTISSLIASVQCQETVKYLHGLPTIRGKAWVFDGMSTDAYQVELQRKPDCSSHETLAEIVSLPVRSETVTIRALLDTARELLGPSAELELPRDILATLTCPSCGKTTPVFASLGSINDSIAACPDCNSPHRQVNTFYKIRGTEPWLDRTASSIGLPPFDIVIARTLTRAIGLEFSGDAPDVLGELCETEALEWL
jgi:adenylyltransferase/sulfurtransferase